MTQKNIKILINEIYSKPPKKNYITNKTNVYHIDDIWSLDILDLKDYSPENNRGYRYVLVTIDNFSKYGWTLPIKNKNAQTIKDSFENILISSKRKPNLIESDRGKEFYNNIFQDLLNKNDIKLYSRKVHMVLFLLKDSTLLLEIYSNDLFLKKVLVIGLMFYLQ